MCSLQREHWSMLCPPGWGQWSVRWLDNIRGTSRLWPREHSYWESGDGMLPICDTSWFSQEWTWWLSLVHFLTRSSLSVEHIILGVLYWETCIVQYYHLTLLGSLNWTLVTGSMFSCLTKSHPSAVCMQPETWRLLVKALLLSTTPGGEFPLDNSKEIILWQAVD